MGIPVVNIGVRQNRRERGNNVIDVDYNSEQIKAAIVYYKSNGRPKPSAVYGGGNAGENIADVLSKVPLRFHKTIVY